MNINFDKNREVMIENQLRPNKITNIAILDIFNKVSKENFISEDKLNICYSDQDITLKDSRGYLKNLHLAQILNFSEIKNYEKVLHIGGLTGYLSVLISKLCKEIIAFTKGTLSVFNYLAFIYLYFDTNKKKIFKISSILIQILHNIIDYY